MILDYLLPFTAGNAALGVFIWGAVYLNSCGFAICFPTAETSVGTLYTLFWLIIIDIDYNCAKEVLLPQQEADEAQRIAD